MSVGKMNQSLKRKRIMSSKTSAQPDNQSIAAQPDHLLMESKIDGLDIPEGLKRYNGDEKVYLNILRSFIAEVRSKLDILENFDGDDLNEYKITVHGIRGASHDIFAYRIGAMTGDLESAVDDNDIDYISKSNPAFISALRKLLTDLDELFCEINTGITKPVKEKPDNEILLRLLSACKEFCLSDAEAAMKEIDEYQYKKENDLVDWLRGNIDMMNFSVIVERLSGI